MKINLSARKEAKTQTGEPRLDDPPGDERAVRLRLSPLFDPSFYAAALAARGGALAGADPLAHYLREGDAARIPPHPLFDPAYYADRNPDVVAAGVNLLQHYLDNGWREGRDPHALVDLALLRAQLATDFAGDPLIAYLLSHGGALRPHRLVDPAFLAAQQRRLDPGDPRPALIFYLASDPETVNPSPDFDGLGYRRLYPDTGAVNPLVHYVRFGATEGRRAPRSRGPLQHVAADIEAAARLDPDIVKPGADPQKTPVLRGYDLARRDFGLFRLLARATGRAPHPFVILTPWLKRGGADRAALHLARALLENDPVARVLIVCTQDDAVEALDWATPTRRLAVARVAREIDTAHDTAVAFCNFLRFIECRHVFVVNSRFGWDLIERYGHALRPAIRLYGFAFCQDYDEAGRRAGYAWTRLNRAIDDLDAVVSDNSRTIHEFAADHGFDATDLARFVALPLPIETRYFGAARQAADNLRQGPRRRHKAIWAGRFSAQKALDVAAAVADLVYEVEIVAYGGAGAPPSGALKIGGPFDDFADLPLHDASLFLLTSRWEGMPNVLLEAGAAGLPIVARDVGGVADLVDQTTGWLLPSDAGAEAFAAAIRELLAHPQEAIARAERMQARIRARHAPEVFAANVERLLAFTGGAA